MKNLKAFLLLVVLSGSGLSVLAQGVGINSTGAQPDPSAMLDISSNSKGFLPPRMSTVERDAISNPAAGLHVYNTDSGCDNFYNSIIGAWHEVCGSCIPQPTTAAAGTDQLNLNGPATLGANTAVQGSGKWTIVSGDGNGLLADSTSATSSFSGTNGVNYTLHWTISNACGSSYDEVEISFWSCGAPITDVRDGKSYNTVEIGTQCWLHENMNYTPSSGTYYCYNNTPANCTTFGTMYTWNTAMNGSTTQGAQGVCPAGWHIATDAEWYALEIYVDPSVPANTNGFRGTDVGTKLKPGGSSGFDMVLGGFYRFGQGFININVNGPVWTSTQFDGTTAYERGPQNSLSTIYRGYSSKTDGFYVRCLQD